MTMVETGRFDIDYIEQGGRLPVMLTHGLAGDHPAQLPQIAAVS